MKAHRAHQTNLLMKSHKSNSFVCVLEKRVSNRMFLSQLVVFFMQLKEAKSADKIKRTTHSDDGGDLGVDEFLGQGLGDGGRRGSHTFVHAEQQLHAHGDACVPSEWEDADVTRHNGRSQQVLHRRGAVSVSIKHLRREEGRTEFRLTQIYFFV